MANAVLAIGLACLVPLWLYVLTVLQWRKMHRRRAAVALTTGRSFEGVLWARRGQLLILRDASTIAANGSRQPVPGEVVLERSRIEFIQVMP